MTYYQNIETGELFDNATSARQDFRENYDGDDPANAFKFWDYYKEVPIPVTYVIQGYEEQKMNAPEPETFMHLWFRQNGYDHLQPRLIFNQSQKNESGYKTTVYIWRYNTLYTETFIFEEREY